MAKRTVKAPKKSGKVGKVAAKKAVKEAILRRGTVTRKSKSKKKTKKA